MRTWRERRTEAGFTMIEMMMVVAVISILSVVAVVSYTRYMRRARSAEVPMMFGELKIKEEAYKGENGVYLSACPSPVAATATTLDCAETGFWPTPLPGRGAEMTLGAFPARWSALHITVGKAGLYCQYVAIGGPAGWDPANLGAVGADLYGHDRAGNVVSAIAVDFFYLLAQCDWDDNNAVNALWWQRGDLAESRASERYAVATFKCGTDWPWPGRRN